MGPIQLRGLPGYARQRKPDHAMHQPPRLGSRYLGLVLHKTWRRVMESHASDNNKNNSKEMPILAQYTARFPI